MGNFFLFFLYKKKQIEQLKKNEDIILIYKKVFLKGKKDFIAKNKIEQSVQIT